MRLFVQQAPAAFAPRARTGYGRRARSGLIVMSPIRSVPAVVMTVVAVMPVVTRRIPATVAVVSAVSDPDVH